MKKAIGILNSTLRDQDVRLMSGQVVFKEDDKYYISESVMDEFVLAFGDSDRFDELSSFDSEFFYVKVEPSIVNSISFRSFDNYQVISSMDGSCDYAFLYEDIAFVGSKYYIKEMLDLLFENPDNSDIIFLVDMLYKTGYYDEATSLILKSFGLASLTDKNKLNHYLDLINRAKVIQNIKSSKDASKQF